MENILINVDTRFRKTSIYPNAAKYKYVFNEPIKNIKYIKLTSIELPTIYYAFDSKYNNTSFMITWNRVNYLITIPNGNYAVADIITAIQIQLDDNINNIPSNIALPNPPFFSITFDSNAQKVYIQNTTSAFYLNFFNISVTNTSEPLVYDYITKSFDFPNINVFKLTMEKNNHPTLGQRLGFTHIYNLYNASKQKPDSNGNYVWVGDSFPNINHDNYIFMRINDFGSIINDVRTNKLLAKIIINDQQLVFDNNNFITKQQVFRQPININYLDIELISPLGETLQFDNTNYSFTLEIGQIYDSILYQQESLPF